MSSVKKATLCALCIALSCVLPAAFHALGLGAAFSPMHLPALLCGLLCGWPYGLFCGVAGPLLCGTLTGMPNAAQLLYMIPELAVYGLMSGLLFRLYRTRSLLLDALLALLPAMLLGRIVGGAAQALFYRSHGAEYTLSAWVSGYLLLTLPGAAVQIALLPPLILALVRAGLIPDKYPKETPHEQENRSDPA